MNVHLFPSELRFWHVEHEPYTPSCNLQRHAARTSGVRYPAAAIYRIWEEMPRDIIPYFQGELMISREPGV